MKYSLKIGVILSALAVVVIMSSAYYISEIFFDVDDEAFAISMNMLMLFPNFLTFNTTFNILMKSYQLQGQTRLVNILSFSENIIMALLAAVFTPIMGANTVWLSFTESDIVCIIVVMISVFIHAKKATFSMEDWIKLPDTFGAKEGQYMEFTITSMEQVMNISELVIDFCTKQGVSMRKSNIADLAVEEMAGNVVSHGFREGRKNYAALRIVNKDMLTIRIRDNCPAFDPKKRLEQFTGDDPASNIGIKMIAKLSDEMTYQNMAGVNTVMIKLKSGE